MMKPSKVGTESGTLSAIQRHSQRFTRSDKVRKTPCFPHSMKYLIPPTGVEQSDENLGFSDVGGPVVPPVVPLVDDADFVTPELCELIATLDLHARSQLLTIAATLANVPHRSPRIADSDGTRWTHHRTS